jgi:hypothetical protein
MTSTLVPEGSPFVSMQDSRRRMMATSTFLFIPTLHSLSNRKLTLLCTGSEVINRTGMKIYVEDRWSRPPSATPPTGFKSTWAKESRT